MLPSFRHITGITAPLLTAYTAMRLKKDRKGEKHLEVRLTQETGVVLTEALTLLHQVSQEASCQRCLVRTKWFAVLLDLSIFSPTHCRQKALMLLSDLLPLATIEVSALCLGWLLSAVMLTRIPQNT